MSINKTSTVNFIIDDDLDYGIEHTEQALHYDVDDNKLESNEILNPFFVVLDGGNVKSKEKSQIYQNYKHLIILCVANNNNGNTIDEKFFD